MTPKKPEAPAPEKRRLSILDSHAVLLISAVLCAVLSWLVVSVYFDSNSSNTVTVPSVTYNYQTSTYTALGLDIVSAPEISNVRVRIEGSRLTIAYYSGEEMKITGQMQTITFEA